MKPSRSMVAPGLILMVAVVTGGWFLQEGVEQEENVYLQARLFQEVVNHVSNQYVEEIEERTLYDHAIDGLLENLNDPNTSFIDAQAYEDFRIRTEGDYGGVGLEITEQEGWVTVVSPIPGTPGSRAGIRAGDRFYSIEGESAEGWDADQAVEVLRGEPGTQVRVEILRPGVSEPIPFTLERAEIQIKAVPFATLLEGDVGYVPLQLFQASSSREVQSAMDSLRAAGAQGFVLDLRSNPGGLLDQGVGVTDLFLDPGQAVVETRGRGRGQSESFSASRPGSYGQIPVVVLVNEASASASEIVAGALQDHDRALLVGNTSFGKGSVQTLFRLSGGNVLRLTTAHWYTPVGRGIQMDHERQQRRLFGADGVLTLSGQPATRADTTERPEFTSRAGRTLYGGGGITPDVIVLPDTLTTEEQVAVRALFRSAGAFQQAMREFAARYIQENPGIGPGFALTGADLETFYGLLEEEGVAVDGEILAEADRFIRYQLGREIALYEWGEPGEFRRTRAQDRQLQRAVELLEGVTSTSGLFQVAGVELPGAAPPPSLADRPADDAAGRAGAGSADAGGADPETSDAGHR